MADLSHYERTKNARDAYVKLRSNARDAEIIAGVLARTKGMPETRVLLEIGGECPYIASQKRECESWLAEVHKQMGVLMETKA